MLETVVCCCSDGTADSANGSSKPIQHKTGIYIYMFLVSRKKAAADGGNPTKTIKTKAKNEAKYRLVNVNARHLCWESKPMKAAIRRRKGTINDVVHCREDSGGIP